MDIARTGIILNTEKFDECVAFYRDIFGLKVLFEESHGDFRLTCFDFGGCYLMVETEGHAKPEGKSIRESPAKLRFNVPDIHATAQALRDSGIDAEIIESDWGSTINIYDPDGNRIGIRDEEGFVNQLGT